MNPWSLFLNHRGRIIHKWVHYFPVYERHFQRFVNRPMTLIEIGCGEGGSLQLWKHYFGPYATIVGLDIRPECKSFEEDQIHVRIGDQSDEDFLSSVIREFGPAQIILDDGSHQMKHIVTSFRSLYSRMAPEGVYLVEDLHTAYWDEYGGGLRKPGSFIELCKDLIDELNAEHSRGSVSETEFSKGTLSIHFYDSVVVFEKGKYGRKYAPRMGKGPNRLDVPHQKAVEGQLVTVQTEVDVHGADKEEELRQLRANLSDLESDRERLNQEVRAREARILELQVESSERIKERDQLRQQINSIQASICWRLTWPVRWLHGQATRASKALRYL